jgi:2-dehydropantoate 2-reductase
MREIGQLPVAKALVKDVMLEASALASALGIVMRRSIDERLAGAESVGEHKTSMLMDLENKKPLEIDGLVGVMIELAEMVDINVPYIRSIYASTQLLQQITLK